MAAVAMLCMFPFIFRWNKLGKWPPMLLTIAALAFAWPWGGHDPKAGGTCVILGWILFAKIQDLPAKLKFPAIGLLASAAIFALMPLFHASSAWYELGFKYGTEKFDFMVTGNGSYNIPRMIQVYFNWPPDPTQPVPIPFLHAAVTFTQLTRIVYAITLILCGIGVAMNDRRRDARFLIGIAAPWLLFFMILTQMHGRYTIWAGAILPLLAGAGAGLTLLAVIVSIIGCMGIMHNQLLFSPRWSPDTLQLLSSLDPGPGIVLQLIAGILLYMAVVPRSRSGEG
jgi:hypothetical protein